MEAALANIIAAETQAMTARDSFVTTSHPSKTNRRSRHERPSYSTTPSIAVFWTSRCGWPRNTALGPKITSYYKRPDRPLQTGRPGLVTTHRRGRVMTKTILPFLASVLLATAADHSGARCTNE